KTGRVAGSRGGMSPVLWRSVWPGWTRFALPARMASAPTCSLFPIAPRRASGTRSRRPPGSDRAPYNAGVHLTRRDAFAALAPFAELLASHDAGAQPPAGPRPVFKHDLPDLTMDGWEVTVSDVEYAPGRVGAPHRHAGFVLAYVLEGAVVAKVSGQGDEK